MTSWAVERTALGRGLHEQVRTILNRSAEGSLRALNAVLRPLLPLASSLGEQRLATHGKSMAIRLRSSPSDGLNGSSHWSGDSDGIRIIASAALYPISRW
jgi:hypothetical protein